MKGNNKLVNVNGSVSALEQNLRTILKNEKLDKFAQLGLKSRWLGIKKDEHRRKCHTRLHHSMGVMKIASYLYEKMTVTSGCFNENEKQFLRIAALLHDLGHIPFSHLIEDVFKELKWRPSGYRGEYSHLFQTEEKIKQIFAEDNELRNALFNLGYSVFELVQLIKGSFGVGYLDAIINSAIDADKIDYIFRDTDSTDKKITLDPIKFLESFPDDLRITPEHFLSITGSSAKSIIELLQTRKFLYNDLYRKPGIVILEGLVKLIIKTFFVYSVELDNDFFISKLRDDKITFPDLGHYKIMFCTNQMAHLIKDIDEDIEYRILEKMVTQLRKSTLNTDMKDCINKAFNVIGKIEGEATLKQLESDIETISFADEKGKKDKIEQTIKDCTLRMPGYILIEIDRTSKFLSIADDRSKRERSDGTETYSECILVPPVKHDVWNTAYKLQRMTPLLGSSLAKEDEARNILVYFYPVMGSQNYKQAKNLFDKLLSKKGLSESD